MARIVGTKQQIINKIIHEDFGMITRKKCRVHDLEPKHKQNR
jgi:hypothetical protein